MIFLVCMSTILAPLLCSILLSTLSNLKLGHQINLTLSQIVSPFTYPINLLNQATKNKIIYLKSLPRLERQNREQKVLIAHLLWQNENLKTGLKNENTEKIFQNKYQKTVSVETSGTSGRYLATTFQDTSEIISGMPLVSGNILLGFVTEKINKNTLRIITIDDNQNPLIPVHTASGQKGVYKFIEGHPQIVNVPSQTPLILGDFVLTEASEIIPANLLIGKITEILTAPQDPLQKGKIDLYDSLENNPEHLAIIVKP